MVRLNEHLPALMMLVLMSAAAAAAALTPHVAAPPSGLVMQPASEALHPTPPETALPAPDVHIEVNIPATEMTLFENGTALFTRRIAIGQGVYPTPEQRSSIKKIEWNPWWYPPPSDWAQDEKPTPPGPLNPMGLVKLPLSEAILFHGTNKPSTVGQAASHGCMRMHNRDVVAIAWYLQQNFSDKKDPSFKELYRKNSHTTYVVPLERPVPVELVYRPVVARDGDIIFYPDQYNRYAGRRKVAIISELLRSDVDIGLIDDAKLGEISARWPPRGTRLAIRDLLVDAPAPDLLAAPECS